MLPIDFCYMFVSHVHTRYSKHDFYLNSDCLNAC